MRINTNVPAITGTHALTRTNNSLNTNFHRLSTGLRINRAADDSAGLGVSESLRTQVRGLQQAMRNANDGISIVQTAEGALNEIHNNLQRLRELAVQSASDTLEATERAYVNTEATQLVNEINRLSNASTFNGIQLLDGSSSSLAVHVGSGTSTVNDQITITLADSTSSALGVTGVDLSTSATSLAAMTLIDTAITSVSSTRANLGAVQNRLGSAINSIQTAVENLSSAESQIRDADFAYETASMAKNQVLQQSGISVLSQANSNSQNILKLLG